jgi:hypothetical protein
MLRHDMRTKMVLHAILSFRGIATVITWLTRLRRAGPARLALALTEVHPLVYLSLYLAAIPTYALLYVYAAPHGFYAPYARYEPSARLDTAEIASALEGALRRSFDARQGREFVVGSWRLDTSSLRVDDIKSPDGTQLSFRVRMSANGIGEFEGARQYGWGIVATVSERPTSAVVNGPNSITTYRFPDVDFSKYSGPFRDDSMRLFELIFGHGEREIGVTAPALALNRQEEERFQRYLRGVKGDASSVSGQLPRMVYLSAVVITTLGLGDIIPMTGQARGMVAAEAIIGVAFAGLFLNALAYRASKLHGG